LKGPAISHLVYKTIQDCVYEECPDKFNEYLEFLFSKAIEGIISKDDFDILRDLFKLKEKWARSQIKRTLFLAGDNYNIIRGDRLTNHLKGELHINSTLCTTLRAILDIESLNEEKYRNEYMEEETK
jgi:hypothetical protein